MGCGYRIHVGYIVRVKTIIITSLQLTGFSILLTVNDEFIMTIIVINTVYYFVLKQINIKMSETRCDGTKHFGLPEMSRTRKRKKDKNGRARKRVP